MTATDCPHYSSSRIRDYPKEGYGVYRCDRCGDQWIEDDAA